MICPMKSEPPYVACYSGYELCGMAVAAAALLAALLAAIAVAGCHKARRVSTPLSDFSAPFVFGRFNVPADNPLTKESVELGRRLFYDPRLSANGKVSCSTCH